MRLFFLFALICNFTFARVVFTNENEHTVSVLDFGAIGNGISDDSDAFEKAIIYCIENNKILYVPKTLKSYNLYKTIRVNLLKGNKIKIISDGAIIMPGNLENNSAYNLTQFKEHIFMSLGRKINSLNESVRDEESYGTSISISGLIFDGANQRAVDNLISYNSDIYIAGQFIAEEVELYNCEFRNIFGYGVRIHEVSKSTIKKCNFLNVGGRGGTLFANKIGDFDAFGDAIYHAKVNTNSNIIIEDCVLIGQKINNRRSRCGITFEYSLSPYKVNLKNLNIEGYAKCLHVEETASTLFQIDDVTMKDFNFGIANVINDKTEMYLNNCTFNVGFTDGNDAGDALAFLNYRSTAKIYVNKSILNFNGRKNAYQSAVGLIKVENSTINGNKTNFFFADGNTVFSSCKFINFGGDQMSFFSNDPQALYQIEKSIFKGISKSLVKGYNVKLIIKDK